ncbi:MAG: hypothetical protein BWK78_00595 [Thiotrichaceae bacterium IS1]|nr:MAG: hypothetical protein BWK78_00595 [Thiotrichaceae bacterium IS1]
MNENESEHNQDQQAPPDACQEANNETPTHDPNTPNAFQTVNNKGPVEKQVNLAGPGVVNIIAGDESAFQDPSQPLHNKSDDLPVVDFPDMEKYVGQLKKERVLLVDCSYDKILHAAMYKLSEYTEFKDYEKCLLKFEGTQSEPTELHVGLLANKKIGRGEKLIVIASLVSQRSQKFWDSMYFKDPLQAQGFQTQLKENDVMLVCLATNPSLFKDARSRLHFSNHWHVDYLPFLPSLLQSSMSGDGKTSLWEKILEQRKKKLWGQSNNDGEFYGLVCGYLESGGLEQLKEEVKNRDKYREGENVQEFLRTRGGVRSEELMKGIESDDSAKNIALTALYVATFFPGLLRGDFGYLVSLLLRDEKVVVSIESQVETKKGNLKTIRTPAEKSCLEIWQNTQDEIMEKCHLKVIRSETDVQIIDFSSPQLRSEVKTYLEQKSLYLRHFERLQTEGLLFNKVIQDYKVIENFINLATEMAISDPSRYGESWLMGVIVSLKQSLKQSQPSIEIDTSNEKDAVFQLLAVLAKHKEGKQQVRFIIARLAELIREMLNRPQLQKIVTQFLDNLLQEKHFDVVLFMVLGIVRQLRFASQFDGMYWIRQLIERGRGEDRNETYKALLDQARQSGFRVYELLDTLKTWLPDPTLAQDKYSSSNKYALKFIIDYARITLSNFNPEIYGNWPSKYPLFATLAVTEEKELAKIDLLVSWVFHPGMPYALSELKDSFVVDRQGVSINMLLADLVELWFKVLSGLNAKNVPPEGLAMSERLLQQIALKTGRSQQRELKKRWQEMETYFRDKISKVDVTDRAQRRKLENEILIISSLRKKFKAFTHKTT